MSRLPLIALILGLALPARAEPAELAVGDWSLPQAPGIAVEPFARWTPAKPAEPAGPGIVAKDANPFDQFDPPKPTGDVDHLLVPVEGNPFAVAPGRRDSDWQDAQGNWVIDSYDTWTWATEDILSICMPETNGTSRYCVCLANRLPKRMTATQYQEVHDTLASEGEYTSAQFAPLARKVREESAYCAQKTGISP
jgi:hypothetical protein